jgi:broad specificity phosphatase PhoE
MKIALIPCAPTEWDEEGRLLGRVDLSPTPAGEESCSRWAELLRPLALRQIYHAPDGLATRTGRLIGRKLLVPTKAARGLAEVDVGLWAGLTEEQLKSRYASVHHELCEAPLNVNPPEGESLGDADARLRMFLKKQLKRSDERALGLVLRPICFALAWCVLAGRALSLLWETAQQKHEPVIIEVAEAQAAPGGERTPDGP